ncbi:MAG TPA: DUF4129 domain-containing protein [Planctomycetota bacterium]|nr:DUF4129 domain-containing protein [Planctomycetota bacterium]
MTGADSIPVEAILRAAERVLRRPEFNPPAWKVWIRERVLDPIGRLLEDLTKWAVRPGGEWIRLALLVLLGAAAAALLARLLAGLLRRREERGRAHSLGRAPGEGASVADPSALEREAERLASADRFAEAVRLLYLAALLRLHERRGERLDASLTPGEQVGRFRGAPFFQRLREFVAAYQRVSFGGRPLDREGWMRLADLRPAEARP